MEAYPCTKMEKKRGKFEGDAKYLYPRNFAKRDGRTVQRVFALFARFDKDAVTHVTDSLKTNVPEFHLPSSQSLRSLSTSNASDNQYLRLFRADLGSCHFTILFHPFLRISSCLNLVLDVPMDRVTSRSMIENSVAFFVG